jgi:glycosyltransferase involved in cell wall biosynthesis
VETLLTAAERFEGNHRLVFLFVGGGSGMAKIRERARPNVLTLPYEPLDRMPFSLAAGDVQVVSLGDSMVGIVHPCKVYGAMASSRPILSLGPPESHVADLVAQSECGWHIAHGDVEGAVRAIEQILSADAEEMLAKGSRGRQLIIENRSKARYCGRVCDVIEREAGVREPFAEPRAATTIADRSDPRWQRQKSGLRSADGSVDAQDVTTQPFVG